MTDAQLFIRQYLHSDHAQVCALFAEGLRKLTYPEGFDIEPYIAESLESDLADIESTYIRDSRSNFWVAIFENRLVGTAAIKSIDPYTAELRRMSVSQFRRRSKIGSTLLKTALEFSIEQRYKTLRLTTTTVQVPAIQLYKKFGFGEYGRTQYGLITAVHFSKDLGAL
tara:strand:+ start:28786 stop:29289 length:504 start_codon:yes stop_codon:yes gene_type:complete